MLHLFPSNESERLRTLKLLKILNTDAEEDFDDLTRLAAQICGVPISAVSLIDTNRQWFKSKVGLSVSETPRDAAFCAHTILKNELFIVPNAANDERFAKNPLVTGDPNIRFYAGAPLVTEEGHALGSLCVIDTVPRELRSEQKEALVSLARQTMNLISLRWRASELSAANDDLNREISKREEAEKNLRLLDRAIAAISEGILISDVQSDNKIIYANDSFERLTGYGLEEIKGLNCNILQGEQTDPATVEVLRKAIGNQEFCAVEILNYRKDGTSFWNALSISPIRDTSGKVMNFVGVQQDISNRKITEEKLIHNALHDALTELPNRTLFLEHLRQTIKLNGTRGKKSFAVLFLDFDQFKVINDSLGHMEGDKLLRLIARRLTDSLRPGDIVARIGGDEFTILLDNLNNSDDITAIIKRIENSLTHPFNLCGNEVFTSASIGVALSDENYKEPETMLRDADIAMYRAKANGKSCHQIFNQTMHKQASSRLKFETELRQAVERE